MNTYTAEVSCIQDLTHDVRAIELRLLDPPTIAFQAGQFISFEVPKEGQSRPVTRPYSIASPPERREHILLVLNLVQGGPGSSYLFRLREGERTSFKGPAGAFYLRDDGTKDLLFVATGTGIAPIRSMILAQLQRAPDRPVTLFWGLRSQRDLYWQDELGALAAAHPRFTVVTTLSRPEPGWQGASGRVTALVEERITSVSNLAAYLCGGSGMIKDVMATLRAKGLCPIYREKYYDE
ncbi:FAD-binding oxidoreductase [Nitrospira defluvii]|uniref:FAD-binding FR-type domain-containing protein n=1 Tax=Nitrospira defluvii TaxID=330214 RepID=A0ABM8QIC8_9BACT|nr:FAD-binding oxidoreductase [Nitrospira defluvii]CAE6698630.1 FAD-binding FR-type domain-containing protein [Nitrospira defluvii]